jgi:polysaccharide export outer membrane protein
MGGVRAVMFGLMAALALSGCMGHSAPVAGVPPQSDLYATAYGQSYGSLPAPMPVAYAAAPTLFVGERWF